MHAQKLLLTPGPLTTDTRTRQAMLRDYGSRDGAFIQLVREIREGLLAAAGTSQAGGHEAVILQGSGTFCVESVLTCAVGARHHLLILSNGAYGERMARIATIHNLPHTVARLPENEAFTAEILNNLLASHPQTTHLAAVHCETTTGILNAPEPLGAVAQAQGKVFILDSMSAFGGVPLHLPTCGADFLVSSSNKCIEGVPGFSFALVRKAALEACKGQSRTLALDLHAQWEGLERDGQFRFTPPTHVLAAFHEALRLLAEEGGVPARHARYVANNLRVREGMAALGFRPFLPHELQAPIISTFLYPDHPNFRFPTFYERLSDRGFVLYPGKLSQAPCFRVGNIGQVFPPDIDRLLAAVPEVLAEMNVRLGL